MGHSNRHAAAKSNRPTEVAMSSTDVSSDSATASAPPKPREIRLEVVSVPVSDADRAKEFYAGLGWREDADIDLGNGARIIQFTPPGSECSIALGMGVTKMEPGSVERLEIAVYDIDAAREDLISHGAEVSELFHLDGGPKPGPDPERRSYKTYATFSDPDGNGWLLQEIKERLPGR
jgi:catechol 2,3-dioxygenase-like lactoylglutathione lyase family enzyme